MDKYTQIYLEKAGENYELYCTLKKLKKFKAWQLTAIFYSALCIAKAYLYNKGFKENSINSHDSIKNLLAMEADAKRNNVLFYYEKLYFDSRDARYSIKKISQGRIDEALKNYEKIKMLLKVS